MNECIRSVHYCQETSKEKYSVEGFGLVNAEKAQKFHKSFPEYSVTPLVDLKNLANTLGVASIRVKDESYRFGLNAFKVLGGSYCIGNYIANRLGKDISEMSYDKITSGDIKK